VTAHRSLERGRLVALGEPGSSKTILATQQVLDLIEDLPTANCRVPGGAGAGAGCWTDWMRWIRL
jgi:hypothetical protein